MEVTVRTPARSLSDEELSRVARALGLALAPYRPRVARAVLRLRDGEQPGGANSRVQITVPLGPAGVVRVQAAGSDAMSASREGIQRAVAAVESRLAAERRELLEFLLVAGGGGRGAVARGRVRDGTGRRSAQRSSGRRGASTVPGRQAA